MSDTDFDAIVVGAGLAGPVAALELARAGKSVLVVERGNFAGAKNMTGGRLYVHSLRNVFTDDDLADAPFERKAKTPITFLTVRPATFADMQATGSNGEAEQLEWVTPTAAVRFISSDPIEKAGVDLTLSLIHI